MEPSGRGIKSMAEAGTRFLERMLERLYAALASGPSLNCRPQNSRQRLDLAQLAKLEGPAEQTALASLLGEDRKVKFTAPLAASAADVPTSGAPTGPAEAGAGPLPAPELDPEEKRRRTAAQEQQSILRKLGVIAEDALEFENETGSQVLHVGFPLLHIPAAGAKTRFGASRRILAPVAFIPVKLSVKRGKGASITIECTGEGPDRVIGNPALLAWLEQQTREKVGELFNDMEGEDPWREINELAALVAKRLELPDPERLGPETPVFAAPTGDDDRLVAPRIVPAAVLGLYPLSNQNLIHDVQALVEGEPASGPVESFLKVDVSLTEAGTPVPAASAAPEPTRSYTDERLVTHADPCQARAVRVARTARGLVVHGPPGTGKSQTIANMIGDHLARGERVLFVCDKRTALDVVKYRLDAIGLGELCAVVHDAQRDQRDLYMGIRKQLDELPDSRTAPAAVAELGRVDAELQGIHAQLTEHDRALAERGAGGTAPSFHDLAGEWLAIEAPGDAQRAASEARALGPEELRAREKDVREALDRGRRAGYPDNPWRSAVGIDLAAWLARPLDEAKASLDQVVAAAAQADSAAANEIPPFAAAPPVQDQAAARESLADDVEALIAAGHGLELARWAKERDERVTAARAELAVMGPHVEVLNAGPLDPELAASARLAPAPMGEQLLWTAKLAAYLAIARRWYRFLFFVRRIKAASILARLGLTFSLLAVERVARFLDGVRARMLLDDLERRLLPDVGAGPLDDERLRHLTAGQSMAFAVLARLAEPALAPAAARIRQDLADMDRQRALLAGLRGSPARARAITAFEREVAGAGLFAEAWHAEQARALRDGETIGPAVQRLRERLPTLEGLLRIEEIVKASPAALGGALRQLLAAGVEAEVAWLALRKVVLAAELSRRVAAFPALQRMDGDALSALHERFETLRGHKLALVRQVVLHVWTDRQRSRLLAVTGGRLNGAGAERKRRLFVRGTKVLRVRQVIAAGQEVEGGDPLFDLRPVWMASPETVAQIFPRQPIFDVFVFDESSQCKLEEAIPVLTRAKRVVIAGDPKQLPPTRFFETTVAQSEAVDAESDQDFFEQQQGEVEDLLTAALNLEIEQSYLDVHYRSQNADLIQFSNDAFYGSRLQAVPAHPSNRVKTPPVKLVHVGGTYSKRENPREAGEVVRIVRDLLSWPQPPSIGVACFNLAQRELILEALDDAAAEDPVFAERLSVARHRRGKGSFEGLFVKNLENVQGDERDHIIISTTYGPDEKGRFYRRFGPLGMAGGGRRLNVLVTRARQQVHLVTSIPREVYRSRPHLEPGQTPGGAWLLFGYLEFAEKLGRAYDGELPPDIALAAEPVEGPFIDVRESETPSGFAHALATRLAAAQGHSATVHWGNDGFCVDVALRHPTSPEDVTVGVLCDNTRFAKAPDRVEWDLFRTAMLRGQGWKLHRLWTPQFFRDPSGALEEVAAQVSREVTRGAPVAAPDKTVETVH
jgi:hypothetical protein